MSWQDLKDIFRAEADVIFADVWFDRGRNCGYVSTCRLAASLVVAYSRAGTERSSSARARSCAVPSATLTARRCAAARCACTTTRVARALVRALALRRARGDEAAAAAAVAARDHAARAVRRVDAATAVRARLAIERAAARAVAPAARALLAIERAAARAARRVVRALREADRRAVSTLLPPSLHACPSLLPAHFCDRAARMSRAPSELACRLRRLMVRPTSPMAPRRKSARDARHHAPSCRFSKS